MASIPPQSDNGTVAAEPAAPSVEITADASAGLTEAPHAVLDTSPSDEKEKELAELKAKWPGWPGCSVFRIVVPVVKVGGIIGKKGDLIKKLVEETRARIRVLDGPPTSQDRIVLISGKEEPEAALPPAIDAIIRIFKRINGLPENNGEANAAGTAETAYSSFRLLVASTQAISLIGKQGSLIKSIQETSGASVRVLSQDEFSTYTTSEERIVELQGDVDKVLKALEGVVGHLRKFLVDYTVLPLFEKSYNVPAAAPAPAPIPQERQLDAWADNTLLRAAPQSSLGVDYPISLKRESLYLDRDIQLESSVPSSRLSMYAQELGLGSRSSTMGRTGGPFVTQIVQTMQIPLAYAEDIIGVQGANIDYIRRSSGAILTVQESIQPDEITVEIKGTSSQVQSAQQLIQDFTNGPREPQALAGSYSTLESSLRGSYGQQLGSTSSYTPSSYTGQPYGGSAGGGVSGGVGGYGSSGVGGYSNYRL